MQAFNLRLIDRTCSSCLSSRACGAWRSPSQTAIQFRPSRYSEVEMCLIKGALHLCLIIAVIVPWCGTFGTRSVLHRWQKSPQWFLSQWNDGWLMVRSDWGNITDNPDHFFPPAGVKLRPFSQDRRRALIGCYLDTWLYMLHPAACCEWRRHSLIFL